MGEEKIIITPGVYMDYYKYGIKKDIIIDLIKKPHWLIVGASGSGKSYALNKYIQQFLALNMSVTVADFKEELLMSSEPYCAIKEFYSSYKDKNPKVLIIDEYASYLAYLFLTDKNKYKEVVNMVAEMLMLARSYKSCIFICMQRADADFFRFGTRDNFFVKILLGDSSPQSKIMLFDAAKDFNTSNFVIGEGLIEFDAGGPVNFKVLGD